MNKRLILMLSLALLAVLTLTAGAAPAQPVYDLLSWWTADAGGGTSHGGGYTLAGTAGQPDAATWQGQGYTLAGGFWGGAGVAYRVYLPLLLRNY